MITAFMRPKDQPNDPWNGNTLEWWTTSPPPVHNFDDLPEVLSERPLFDSATAGPVIRPPRGNTNLRET